MPRIACRHGRLHPSAGQAGTHREQALAIVFK